MFNYSFDSNDNIYYGLKKIGKIIPENHRDHYIDDFKRTPGYIAELQEEKQRLEELEEDKFTEEEIDEKISDKISEISTYIKSNAIIKFNNHRNFFKERKLTESQKRILEEFCEYISDEIRIENY